MEIPKLLIISLSAGLLTQLTKFIIQISRHEFRWSSIREYGGMPSAHTAFVVSLSTVVALSEGLNSAAFAIAAIFSLLIIRDAIGLRQFISQHGKILNMLIKDLPDDAEEKYPGRIEERFGHTPLQAAVGGLMGFGIALGLWHWWV